MIVTLLSLGSTVIGLGVTAWLTRNEKPRAERDDDGLYRVLGVALGGLPLDRLRRHRDDR